MTNNTSPNLKLLTPQQQQESLCGMINMLIQSSESDPRSQQIIEDTLIFVRDSISKMINQPPSTTH